MTKILNILIFAMGYVVAMLLALRIFSSGTRSYGVDPVTTFLLTLLVVLCVAGISSFGYGIGLLFFNVPPRYLHSFIFGVLNSGMTLGVDRITRKLISPMKSNDLIVVIFMFLGGFLLAYIIKWFIGAHKNNTSEKQDG